MDANGNSVISDAVDYLYADGWPITLYVDNDPVGTLNLDGATPDTVFGAPADPAIKNTDANGSFQFNGADDGLIAGNYIVAEGSQSGWLQTYPVDSTSSKPYYAIALGPYDTVLNRDFGNVPYASIIAKKLVDLDGSKATTDDQSPFVGWAMELKRWDGEAYSDTFKNIYGTLVDGTQVTGAGGTFTWSNLTVGDYQVTEGNDVAYIHLDDPANKTATLAAGDAKTLTFYNTPKASLTAKKVIDLDGDKATTSDQSVYTGGWAMTLEKWVDGAWTGIFKDIHGAAVDGTQVTDGTGVFTWSDLTVGDYQVTEGNDVAYIHLDDPANKTATLAAGDAKTLTFIQHAQGLPHRQEGHRPRRRQGDHERSERLHRRLGDDPREVGRRRLDRDLQGHPRRSRRWHAGHGRHRRLHLVGPHGG